MNCITLVRSKVLGAAAFAALVAGCATPVSKSLEVHTVDVDCDEANRAVYDTVVDMGAEVEAFRPAKTGRPGYLKARKTDGRGTMNGEVDIRCDADGVHIDPRQSGLGDASFERGIFLGFTGRTGLQVDRGVIKGREGAVGSDESSPTATSAPSAAGAAAPSSSDRTVAAASSPGVPATTVARKAPTRRAPPMPDTLEVTLEPVRGFATVLDFDADLSAAGLLPIKVAVRNGSDRAYLFDPRQIAVRKRGSRQTADPLSADAAAAKVEQAAANQGSGTIGDAAAAGRRIRDGQLERTRLAPGDSIEGYLLFPAGDYDRARVRVIDVATQEAEGFMVEF